MSLREKAYLQFKERFEVNKPAIVEDRIKQDMTKRFHITCGMCSNEYDYEYEQISDAAYRARLDGWYADKCCSVCPKCQKRKHEFQEFLGAY